MASGIDLKIIDKLPNLCVDLKLVSVYDSKCYSNEELVYLLCQKINEVIVEQNRFEKVTLLNFEEVWKALKYLLGEGLANEVKVVIESMLDDGRLADIINVTIFKDLNDKIEANKVGISDLNVKVNKNVTDILSANESIASNLAKIVANTNSISTNLVTLNGVITDLEALKGTIIYMCDFPKDTRDYSVVLNPITSKTVDCTIVCENNKEYPFRTPLKLGGRTLIQGNDSLWRYYGNSGSTFITFVESPWMIEGSVIENLIIWCKEKSVGAYQHMYGIRIQGNHINIKFRNIKMYNFGYMVTGAPTSLDGVLRHTFGHSFIGCSFWGFIVAMNFTGNCEQVLIQHCWLDDGKRTTGSSNACIIVADATSFWIRDNIIQNCDIGIILRGVKNGEVTGNHFENMINTSIYMRANSVYENRNVNITGNWLVGHNSGIEIANSGTGVKTVHTSIIGNCFGYLGVGACGVLSTAGNTESNTMLLNNSLEFGYTDRPMTRNITTIKEFQ